MRDYKIRYRNGSTQGVSADIYQLDRDFFVFSRNRQAILSVPKADVASVGLAELDDPESSGPGGFA